MTMSRTYYFQVLCLYTQALMLRLTRRTSDAGARRHVGEDMHGMRQ